MRLIYEKKKCEFNFTIAKINKLARRNSESTVFFENPFLIFYPKQTTLILTIRGFVVNRRTVSSIFSNFLIVFLPSYRLQSFWEWYSSLLYTIIQTRSNQKSIVQKIELRMSNWRATFATLTPFFFLNCGWKNFMLHKSMRDGWFDMISAKWIRVDSFSITSFTKNLTYIEKLISSRRWAWAASGVYP